MANCIYCGTSTGFFQKNHKKCKQQHEYGQSKIVSSVSQAGSQKTDLPQLEIQIDRIAETSHIGLIEMKALLIAGWENAVEAAFDDGILTEEEETALSDLKQHFELTQNELDRNGAFSQMVKGAVLRDVLNGDLPERIQIAGNLPFNLKKTEKLVWLFQDVDYYEEVDRTRYIGGSQSVSIRIAKGLYYRTGAFKGERVQTPETVHIDTGLLGVTSKHIYFSGSAKSFRIAFNKIVSFEPFSDGIGVQRDTATAKPQSFYLGDGWFAYNLITNLAQI